MTNALAGRRILVTGGAGFLGRPVCDAIQTHAPAAVLVPRKAEYDLTEQAAVRRMLDDLTPDMVVHFAAVVVRIGLAERDRGELRVAADHPDGHELLDPAFPGFFHEQHALMAFS